jgi:hypothetical protein
LYLGICKLLCTREGLLINKTVINKSLLALWLERLSDVDWSNNPLFTLLNPLSPSGVHEKVHALLSPKDAQDVPRAIKLLNLTADIRNLETNDFNPSEQSTHNVLSLLGEMLEAVLKTFIDHNLTLSEQVINLVKFAHIACALFREHESDFMPNHLYSDLQCMVRTAIFRVAHTKVLDPNLKVFFCLLGDDVLEIFFGRTRMIGGHSPNVDVDELRNRFAAARRLDGIFQDYPEWERRPRRLKLTRSRDVDHLMPRHWTKELRASSCDLQSRWETGVSLAEKCLSKAGYTYNFSLLFHDSMTTQIDLMRPKGGKHPGISSEVDRSLGDGESDIIEKDAPDSLDTSLLSFNGRAVLEAEKRARIVDEEQEPPSIWMKLNNQPTHKKSILRVFMDPALDIDYHKSHDRLLRVRCFSIGGDSWDRSQSSVYRSLQVNAFRLGSLFATAICTDKNIISIAILHCTALKSGSQYFDQAPIDEISLVDSTWEISGQILSLHPILYPNIQGSELSWVWDNQFAALNPTTATGRSQRQQQSSVTKMRHLNVTVNGRATEPLRPSQYLAASFAVLGCVC